MSIEFTEEEEKIIFEIAKFHFNPDNQSVFESFANHLLDDTPEPTDLTNALTVLKSHNCAVKYKDWHELSDELAEKLIESYKDLEKFIYER